MPLQSLTRGGKKKETRSKRKEARKKKKEKASAKHWLFYYRVSFNPL